MRNEKTPKKLIDALCDDISTLEPELYLMPWVIDDKALWNRLNEIRNRIEILDQIEIEREVPRFWRYGWSWGTGGDPDRRQLMDEARKIVVRCDTCVFFYSGPLTGARRVGGECRRRAPVRLEGKADNRGWPGVDEHDFCGEWRGSDGSRY